MPSAQDMDLSAVATALEPWAVLIDAIIAVALVVPPAIHWIQVRRQQYDRLAELNHLIALYNNPNPNRGLGGWRRVARSIGAGLGGAASGAINVVTVSEASRALGPVAGFILAAVAGALAVIAILAVVHRILPTPAERQARLRVELTKAERRIL
jgi:hypothetical protein